MTQARPPEPEPGRAHAAAEGAEAGSPNAAEGAEVGSQHAAEGAEVGGAHAAGGPGAQVDPRAAVDPDVDLHVPAQRGELARAPVATLAVIAAGGVLGALARYAVLTAFPVPPGGFAWPTLAVNVTGCLLIGLLMVAITEVWQAHPLTRPFLGVGVLGGFTTFSTSIADAHGALAAGQPRTALAYLAVTLVTALAAVFLGQVLGRGLFGRFAPPADTTPAGTGFAETSPAETAPDQAASDQAAPDRAARAPRGGRRS
ncbi:CrcB family protein [Nonomuraea sp. NPDC049758]|uniref:fluoride efflux transporter FluC n=1 Tax=Nonomuraea sp. NPDC049758 TaxID=3154360 RepID=UPI00342DE037